MNRRSILRLLGLAPVAAPLAVAAAARAVTEAAPLSRAYGVSMAIEGQASAVSLLSTRVAGHEALFVEAAHQIHALKIHHPTFTDGHATITA